MPTRLGNLTTVAARRSARLAHRARARAGRAGGRAAILLYHRVATPEHDAWDLSVSPQSFAAHMELLAERYRPLALADLLAAADAGTIPQGAVTVTFDDGYLDNLEAALPALERHGVPATVYVATGYVGRDIAYWWDEIEHLMMAPAGRPEPELTTPLAGRAVTLAVADAAERERALIETVQPGLRRSTPDQIEATLAATRAWASREPAPSPDGGRCVRADELARLAASELIEIGGHTRRHPSLRAVGRAGAAREIAASRADLAELLGTPPQAFSYPFGDLRPGYGRLVRQAGFTSAVGTQWGIPTTTRADRFQLPRTVVADVSADHLDRELAALLD